jgi:hypothetical protein
MPLRLAAIKFAVRLRRRLHAALEKTGPAALERTLQSLKLRSLDQVSSLETLKRVVLAVEAAASALK